MELLLLAAVGCLIFCSGLTSMTEAALFSVPLSKVHLAVERKRHGAVRLLRIKQNIHRPVAALVILNNCINIGGSISVGLLAEQVFGSTYIALFTAALTLLVILFAEIVPKTLGERFCETIALAAAPPLTVVTRALSPLIWLVEKVTRPFASDGQHRAASEEEIRILASLGRQTGTISGHETELIHRVFRLNDVTAQDIMTHRLKLSTLPAEKKLSELKLEELDFSHSRILVTEGGDLDRINGIVYLRDILLALAQGKTDLTVGDLKQPAIFVYAATPAHRLLRMFQKTRQHLFVVLDEYGGTCGVVTLEDVLEELVGEIHDETDPLVEPEFVPPQRVGGSPALESGAPARPPEESSLPVEVKEVAASEAEDRGGVTSEPPTFSPAGGSGASPVTSADPPAPVPPAVPSSGRPKDTNHGETPAVSPPASGAAVDERPAAKPAR